MGDLTTNLSRAEFDCPCELTSCSRTPVDYMLAHTIQRLADHFLVSSTRYDLERISVTINSGLRCRAYDKQMKLENGLDFNNKKVSEHVWGIAADIKFEMVFKNDYKDEYRELVNPDEVAEILDSWFPYSYGIGQYNGRTHFDTRPEKARWDNR